MSDYEGDPDQEDDSAFRTLEEQRGHVDSDENGRRQVFLGSAGAARRNG
ncbi:hypothetical protein BN903_4 [Halorubrum sp. AJ67]|nr:hypothetical protein BN903_4 [Halorubrum sp. AJ67]